MKILILANKSTGLYKFRGELLEALIAHNHEVYLSVPNGDFIAEMQQMGCHFIETEISRHGVNPFTDLALVKKYCLIIKSVKPDIVFTYTIKPNVYGGIACRWCKVPYVANVTGLGTAVENKGLLQTITLTLYKMGLKKAQRVFFQNQKNQQFMLEHGVVKGQYSLLPGSGVNLERFEPLPYPAETNGIHFVFISRIMREKGIDQYLAAAKHFKAAELVDAPDSSHPERSVSGVEGSSAECSHNVTFHICGFCEKEYQGELDGYAPIQGFDKFVEEVVDDGVNGFIVKQRDSADLIQKIEQFIALLHEEKMKMGLAGRAKVEREFNRKIVVDAYLKETEAIND